MQLYYFILKNGHHAIPDRRGEEFADEGAARAHAVAVARELMRNGSLRARTWRLEVCDEYLQPRFELLFASIDDSLSHLPLACRNSIEHACRNTALLHDSIANVQKSLLEVAETLTTADQIMARISFRGSPSHSRSV
jgi:hypothetical protein